jgi:hypothetical protein
MKMGKITLVDIETLGCKICGAVVINTKLHDVYHAKEGC